MQYEAGVKLSTPDDRVTLTTALFKTLRDNVFQQLLINGVETVVFNDQETKGFEADLELHPIDRWKILANFTLQHAELTNNPSQPAAAGKQPPGVPLEMFNLWSTYDFAIAGVDGFRVGAGMRQREKIYADALNTNSVPSYTLVDAMFGYYQPTWDVALIARNITDRRYFITANGSGGYVGDPFSVFLKASLHQ
jgi:iron complex outermembrane receptor protein